MKKNVKKSILVVLALTLSAAMLVLPSCSGSDEPKEQQEVNLFVAASLTDSIDEIVKDFEKENPKIKVLVNADSSGKLKTQIMEGFDCDIFFSAATREVDELKTAGLIGEKDSANLLENQLAIIGIKGYKGKVKDLDSIKEAGSIALPYGSVPAGMYTRKALINKGMLTGDANNKDAVKAIPGSDVAAALGGVTISEKDNVSTTITAVGEGSTEIGFAYTSDVKRNANTEIIKKISKKLTGDIIYPVAKIKAKDGASEDHKKSVEKLYEYLQSDAAKKIYEKYGFTAK